MLVMLYLKKNIIKTMKMHPIPSMAMSSYKCTAGANLFSEVSDDLPNVCKTPLPSLDLFAACTMPELDPAIWSRSLFKEGPDAIALPGSFFSPKEVFNSESGFTLVPKNVIRLI